MRIRIQPGLETRLRNLGPCDPSAGEIPADAAFHPVRAELTGLQANDTTYRFRLKATNPAGTVVGRTLTFTTTGEPRLDEVRASGADREGSATLEATVDPGGFPTTYRIEWGPTEAYSQIATSGMLGASAGPTRITGRISGLDAGGLYHYRVVATNPKGTATSLGRGVESLNSCGLPQGRCLELVSPREVGTTALPGKAEYSFEAKAQASTGPGGLAYRSEGGFPGARRGSEVFYKAKRGASGWASTEVSPPVEVTDETRFPQLPFGENSNSSRTLEMSPELSCGVVESNQPLTPDTGMKVVVEAGASNLYRYNADGAFTAITRQVPENAEELFPGKGIGEYYNLAGMSSDCSRIFFYSYLHYHGTGGSAQEQRLYEWDGGTLRRVGLIPGPGGEEVTAKVVAGGGPIATGNSRDELNAVSRDGSRIFLTANRQVGAVPGEEGQTGVFVREGGVTKDLSASETAEPNTGATYQYATPDGSRVFFTANAGLTPESNAEGQDLYEYSLSAPPGQEPLKDLSVSTGGGPANVQGVLGTSEDGSIVYFGATGQLVPERGLSEGENQTEGALSVYRAQAGQVSFVATVGGAEAIGGETPRLFTRSASTLTSRVSPDGRYLLFESQRPVTAYQSGGALEAYLFDGAADREAITCISCRPDGRESFGADQKGVEGVTRLPFASVFSAAGSAPPEPLALPTSLMINGGEPSVFFMSFDPLAPGGVEGSMGLYEWSHGQVFLVDQEPPELTSQVSGVADRARQFLNVFQVGASAEGTDLYFSTPQSLTWEDGDERSSIYDARVGGGFQEPAPPPQPCQPVAEGSCQLSPSSPPAGTSPGSNGFVGPGNPKPKQCKKGQVKKKNKCVKKKAAHQKHAKKHKKSAKGKKAHGKKNHGKGKRGAGK